MSKRSRQRSMIPLDKMVEESIAFIREHEPPEGYFVCFSGGKDSICTLELTRMAGVKHEAYYSCTGIDPPEVVKFIKQHYPDVKWLYPKMSFWEGIRKKNPPLRVTRWCCDVLKKNPSSKIPLNHRMMGLRAEESNARASRPMVDKFKGKQVLYKPIFHWLEWHVWEFIEDGFFPYPSLYDEGFGRIGCTICPFQGRLQKLKSKNAFPKQYAIFEKVVRDWWDNHGFENNPMEKRPDIVSFDDYMNFWFDDPKFKNYQPPCTCPANDCAGITQIEMSE